eukprot:GHRQ01017893.1.p1 GENE.GHRQ01017893.1~~GHRQ01017893.1.p1  ORF type:complete len:175 (+),score=68.55 GHRQ01017893.1:1739-2263(+)
MAAGKEPITCCRCYLLNQPVHHRAAGWRASLGTAGQSARRALSPPASEQAAGILLAAAAHTCDTLSCLHTSSCKQSLLPQHSVQPARAVLCCQPPCCCAATSLAAMLLPPRRLYDLDQDGCISAQELYSMLQQIVGEGVSDQQLERVVQATMLQYDTDGDWSIDFREFVALMNR